MVLEGAARDADLPTHPRLDVVRAPADGDASIVELVRDLGGAGVVVVTADRGLRERVHAEGGSTVGPGVLLHALAACGLNPRHGRRCRHGASAS